MSGRDGWGDRDFNGRSAAKAPSAPQILAVRGARLAGYVSLPEALAFFAWQHALPSPRLPFDKLPRARDYSPQEGPVEAHALAAAVDVPPALRVLLSALAEGLAEGLYITRAGNSQAIHPHVWRRGSDHLHHENWNREREFASDPPHLYLTHGLRFAAYVPERQPDEDRIQDTINVMEMDGLVLVSLPRVVASSPGADPPQHQTASAPARVTVSGLTPEAVKTHLAGQPYKSAELRWLLASAIWNVLTEQYRETGGSDTNSMKPEPVPWARIREEYDKVAAGDGGESKKSQSSKSSFHLGTESAGTTMAKTTWDKLRALFEQRHSE